MQDFILQVYHVLKSNPYENYFDVHVAFDFFNWIVSNCKTCAIVCHDTIIFHNKTNWSMSAWVPVHKCDMPYREYLQVANCLLYNQSALAWPWIKLICQSTLFCSSLCDLHTCTCMYLMSRLHWLQYVHVHVYMCMMESANHNLHYEINTFDFRLCCPTLAKGSKWPKWHFL